MLSHTRMPLQLLERRKKMIKWIIKDLKLASKEDWVYLALSLPIGLVALADWFIF